MEDERTLLEKLARGDRASFDALYMRYAAKTEEFLCRMLKNRAEAEDITHDLFLKIWQNRSTMAGVTAFGSYLFRMARNAVYDRFDSRTVRTNFARQTNLLPEYELPDVDNRDLLLLIQLAVEKMPGQRQRIFRMSREEGIANDEIARRHLHTHRRKSDFEGLVRTAQTRHADPVFLLKTFFTFRACVTAA